MVFKEIFGQEDAINMLKHDLQMKSVAHAYLFNGPLGIGKTKTAFQFAKAIACQAGGCKQCKVCQSFDRQIHPDFQLIRAAGNFISIDQVRQLEHWVVFKASQALRKVVIIEEIERLTLEAANALLKTLEEPPEDVVFINITSNQNAVLPTILSRCRHIGFKPITSEALAGYLNKQGYSKEKIKLAAALSQGIFGKAIELLENEDPWKLRAAALDCLKNCLSLPVEKINVQVEKLLQAIKPFQAQKVASSKIKQIEQQSKRKRQVKNQQLLMQAIDFWWFWLRDIVVFSETGSKESLINIDYFDEIAKRWQNNEVDKSWYLMQKIPKIKELIKQNINPQLALETLLMETA